MAKVEKLNKFSDLNLIGSYADRFKLNPDRVLVEVSFNTVMNFLWMWKEQSDYDDRYREAYEMVNKK